MNAQSREQILRTVSWNEAVEFLTARRIGRRGHTSAAAICHATLGLVPYVPEPLRHIGCMWLEEGDEARRCNREATWTMGTTLEWPRLYCEEHAQRILARRRGKARPSRNGVSYAAPLDGATEACGHEALTARDHRWEE